MKNATCNMCHRQISFRVERYSMNVFKKPLCVLCQKKEREVLYPKKLADLINNTIQKHYGKTCS